MVARHVRDVEAGSSNLPTPTKKPLVTGLREQPGPGVRSFSAPLGAILGAIARPKLLGPFETRPAMPSKSSTRSHGEGSIYRSDYTRPATGVTVERWIASVDLGVGANGKRLRKKITGPSRKAVADKLRKLQREQDAGVDVRKSR